MQFKAELNYLRSGHYNIAVSDTAFLFLLFNIHVLVEVVIEVYLFRIVGMAGAIFNSN